MAYSQHVLTQFFYALPGGERATVGLRWAYDSPALTQPVVQAMADAVRVPWATFHTQAGSRMSGNVQLLHSRVALIAPSGKALLAAESTEAGPTPGSGTVSMPNEVAVCLSLRTNLPQRIGRGRIYLPCLAVTMTSLGKITTSQPPALVENAKTAVAGVSAALAVSDPGPGAYTLVVASKTSGLLTPVTSLRVGDVPDVQRRRQYDINEEYSSVTYP